MVLHIIWDWMTVEFIISVTLATILGIFVAFYYPRPRSIKSKHVMITGGSSGIGKYVAIEAVRNGANVSIIARNASLLEEAREEILKHVVSSDQKVACFPTDVSGSYNAICHTIAQAEEELGPVFLLVNCAGYAKAARFEDTAVEVIENLMRVNYFGAAHFSHAVIPGLKGRREGGIVFVSSQAGLSGVFGFAAYSSSKFALRGLAESLKMELKPYQVSITMGFPPDTDTPGFATENKDKPEETRRISESAGLFPPSQVAKVLLNDSLRGSFMSTVGTEGYLQSIVCAGMAPVTWPLELVQQVCLMGIVRFISAFYLYKFDRIVQGCMQNRNQKKRSE